MEQDGAVMTGNRVQLDDPLSDGRQSDTAARVWRGAARMLRQAGFSVLGEVTLASGRRADLLAVSAKGDIWIIEVKSSLADLRSDGKWPDYRLHCDRFFFATHAEVPASAFPEEAGLILSDGHFAEVMRAAPEHRLAAATRKAVTLRFAQAAANRLHTVLDPGFGNV